MFTGIVETTGKVVSTENMSVKIESPFIDLQIGESISINGVCLTVTSVAGGTFEVDLSEETVQRTNLGRLEVSDRVNLERPLRSDGRFGGHFVQGHIDAAARIEGIEKKQGSTEMLLSLPDGLGRYLVEKGSVTLDGVSLTVTTINRSKFGVSLIPHTLQATTLGERTVGDALNMEVDVLAKYVERLVGGRNE